MTPTEITKFAEKLWAKAPRSSIKIFELLETCVTLEGEICDLGCGTCRSSLFIQYCLDYLKSNKKLHVFDAFPVSTFSGSPCSPSEIDSATCDFERGRNLVNSIFEEHNLKKPEIICGWVSKTLELHLPERICFANISLGFYQPTVDALLNLYDRLTGVCTLEGYQVGFTPCVEKATKAFFVNKPEKVEVNPNAGQGYFWKYDYNERNFKGATVSELQMFDLLGDEEIRKIGIEKIENFQEDWAREEIIERLVNA